MTEAVLTRLRDFSCKATTFDDCKSAGPVVCRTRDNHPGEGVQKDHRAGEGSPYRLDIESALAWLRRELMEMRSQDQALIRQLMDLHTGIQELKLDCAEIEGGEENEPEEEGCWESGSEGGGSSVYSSSGEVGLSISCLSSRITPYPHGPKRLFCRRSSVP